MRVRDILERSGRVGPLLFCRGWHDRQLRLAALLAIPEAEPAPELEAGGRSAPAETLQRRCGWRVLCYEFSLPGDAGAEYRLGHERYPVNARWEDDLRIAYVACNGQEHDDRERLADERNVLWQRLERQNDAAPLHLLLHGGDQLYADEMLQIHPAIRAWARHQKGYRETLDVPDDLETRLADYLFIRYLELYSQPAMSRVMARVPSLAIWDDHDICDGWGSRPAEQLDSPVGQRVFRAAREQYLLFQMAARPDSPPAICADPAGETLTWGVQMPSLRIVAPDLRSERRPDRVMGENGWRTFEALLTDPADQLVLVLSSVPALGPRLSLVESLLHLIPQAQKYEDDLRDQWQSRAHRDEWRRFLEALLAVHRQPGAEVVVLSGEIHLATRGTLKANGGHVHQLVSSGIAHPPPPQLYARALGLLARLGESPLVNNPIHLWPLPACRGIYTAERNYLMLERRAGKWVAWWELEHRGPTPLLELH